MENVPPDKVIEMVGGQGVPYRRHGETCSIAEPHAMNGDRKVIWYTVKTELWVDENKLSQYGQGRSDRDEF